MPRPVRIRPKKYAQADNLTIRRWCHEGDKEACKELDFRSTYPEAVTEWYGPRGRATIHAPRALRTRKTRRR